MRSFFQQCIHIPFDHDEFRKNCIPIHSYLEGEEGLESSRLDGGGGIGGDLGEGGDFHDDEEKIDFNPKFKVASALVLTDNLDSAYSPSVPRGTSNRCLMSTR